MNDRKRAWQYLHREIRRRALKQDGSREAILQDGTILREVVSQVDFATELAGFGAIFALMQRGPEKALLLADRIGAEVMQEPDERDDDEI
jgi:hypothetical protein